jgi:hypothetical protein
VSTTGGLLASFIRGADVGVARITPGRVESLWHEPVTIGAGDARFAVDVTGKTIAAEVESFTQPAHVIRGPLDRPATITHDNDAITTDITTASTSG